MFFPPQQYQNKERASPQLNLTTCLFPALTLQAGTVSQTALTSCARETWQNEAAPPRRAPTSRHRGTSSIQCTPAPLPLYHRVWRRKVGRGTRLMMVLTAYLSSSWRVMRHLSNLNIFHWAVMALSPEPHVCVRVPVCACASVRHWKCI